MGILSSSPLVPTLYKEVPDGEASGGQSSWEDPRVNVAVLSRPQEVEDLVSILGILQRLDIPAYGLKVRETWDRIDSQGLYQKVQKASHLLIVANAALVDEAWFLFASGFALGRSARFCFYRKDPSWNPPPFLSNVPILDGEDELTEYYRIEKIDWEVLEQRRLARSSLLELGISTHAESMANCVNEGDLRAVELFLKAGFLPNSRDKHGVPALCLAARSKHRSVAALLLDFGADIDLQSEDRGYSALMDASLAGSLELVDLLLSRGANPNLVSKDGQTALVVAVGKGDLPISSLLLKAGADPDIQDKLGFSARKYVGLFKKPDLLSLFEAGQPSA